MLTNKILSPRFRSIHFIANEQGTPPNYVPWIITHKFGTPVEPIEEVAKPKNEPRIIIEDDGQNRVVYTEIDDINGEIQTVEIGSFVLSPERAQFIEKLVEDGQHSERNNTLLSQLSRDEGIVGDIPPSKTREIKQMIVDMLGSISLNQFSKPSELIVRGIS